jgi:isoamylase
VLEVRERRRRSFLATLLLSQGIPMLLGGDEIGRTQRGNNNAYCQDNEISWVDWEHEDGALLAFVQRLIAFRRAHPVFRRRHFFHGESLGAAGPDIAWFRPDGSEMKAEDWSAGFGKAIGVFLNGETIPSPDARGQRVVDDSFLLLFNAHHEPLSFRTPPEPWGAHWLRTLDTADTFHEGEGVDASESTTVEARSLALFRRTG